MSGSVFVTGAYGMLGSWLVRALLDRGDRVTVLRRDDVPGSALVVEGLEARCAVVHGDLCEPGLLERAIGEHEADTVFHLAAQTIVGTAQRSPLSTWETNVRGTYLLLEACRTVGVDRVVVAASDKAYGAHDQLPYREDFALQPRFPYDVSKAATDLIARSYWHTYGLPVATTRFANIYGGGDLNPSRLVPEAVAAALAGRSPVIRSDGSPERDYLYVEDAVAAYLAITDGIDAGVAAGEAFNAGTGKPVSVIDLVRAIARAADRDIEPDIRGSGTPNAEIDRQYVDITKIGERCGWTPSVDLDEGMRRAIEWYRAHPEVLAS
jgi:CDP-glucose 4,6-dehydratase